MRRGDRGFGDSLLEAFGASAPNLIQEIGFALDSPLEGTGFELAVPRAAGFGPFSR
jgi:hypothetical protein